MAQKKVENGNVDPGAEGTNKVASEPVERMKTITPIGYKKTIHTGIATDSGS